MIQRGNGQNYTKDEHGRFTGSTPAGNKSGGISGKGLDKSGDSGIIVKNKNIIPCDSNGIPFTKPQRRLPKKEYGKIISAIDDAYHIRYDGKKIGIIQDRAYKAIYYFEIHGYNEYNIFSKEKD